MSPRAARHRWAVQLAGVLALGSFAAGAQTTRSVAASPRRTCDGDTVTSIVIHASAPSSRNHTDDLRSDLRSDMRGATARVLHMPHMPTRANVIAAYLRLAVGSVCTERDRQESERLLRAQPFIATAVVRAIPDTPGRVHITVDVIDELRPIIGAGISHGTLSSLLLGTQEFGGRGLALDVEAERGFAYRNGFGARAMQYGVFGRPDFVSVEAQRHTVDGQTLRFEYAEPYLTDLQLRAFHASTSELSGYTELVRPTGDNVSLFVRRTSYDLGWVTRLRRASGRGTVILLGAALLGEDVRTASDLVIVSDTGLIKGPVNPFAFPAFATTRVAAIGGLRALRFATVRGFDALTAEQDMGIGVQFDVLAGSSVLTPAHARDGFFAADFYAGAGGPQGFVVLRALAEARAVKKTHEWEGVVASSRLAWYRNVTGVVAHIASLEFSGIQRVVFPAQLTFGDAEGGLPGFTNSSYAGGTRLIARVEQRRLVNVFRSHADAAIAVFATAGKLWAGDVPYGRTTAVHGAAGLSLLAAYPGGGKRTYRVDLSVPFNPEPHGSRLELRFSATDRTRLLWREPSDVARVRTGAVPVSLMKW